MISTSVTHRTWLLLALACLSTAGCAAGYLATEEDEDHDGVADVADACVGSPEGVEVDSAGCAFDDDGDGVYNYRDDCPDTPGGGYVDGTGCPTDGDGDGVLDGLDQCASTPSGATIDDSGCPMDSDGDGVYDGIDTCPGTPEGREVSAEGCGEFEAALAQGRLVLRNINFAFNSATLDDKSETTLSDVAIAIRNAVANRPGITIEIHGHTDAIGSEEYNQLFSEQRAAAVRDYLLSVEPSLALSLTTRGYGESSPVAVNDTEQGRAENRRVEFIVIDGNGRPPNIDLVDGDGDGVRDVLDDCEGTEMFAHVDAAGCPSDADGDGVLDGIDACPNTSAGEADMQGCSPADALETVRVEVWTVPAGADVFFIPEKVYQPAMAKSTLPNVLDRWRVHEGPTDVDTYQYERRYTVLFRFADTTIVRSKYPVVSGRPNRIGVLIDELKDTNSPSNEMRPTEEP